MTGFGRSESSIEGGRLIVEARSENHRFLDVRVQLPDTAGFLEAGIVKQIKRVALRGKIKTTVINESNRASSPEIDLRAARSVLSDLKGLKKNLRLKGEITIDHLVSFGDLIGARAGEKKPGAKEVSQIRKAAARAVENLDESRSREGKRLQRDLTLRTAKCRRLVEKIKSESKKSAGEIKRKLVKKTKSLVKDKNMDGAKMCQEVSAILEKNDITEEIVRINSHLSRFSEFLSKENVSVGKELDFLTQEMNREAGTISAKSKSSAISHMTIDLRSEIEKMREQAQNVE